LAGGGSYNDRLLVLKAQNVPNIVLAQDRRLMLLPETYGERIISSEPHAG
jgi:hypothetical protein